LPLCPHLSCCLLYLFSWCLYLVLSFFQYLTFLFLTLKVMLSTIRNFCQHPNCNNSCNNSIFRSCLISWGLILSLPCF
jgi:hypothetical protein